MQIDEATVPVVQNGEPHHGAPSAGAALTVARSPVEQHGGGGKHVHARAGLVLPRTCTLALTVVAVSVSAALRAPIWGIVVPVGVSVCLAGAIWAVCAGLPPFWRSRWARPVVLRAALRIAVAASLAWLTWLRPSHWQQGLVIAVTIALTVGQAGLLGRHARAFARRVVAQPLDYSVRRSGIVNRTRDIWRRIPAGGRTAIGLLALLNVLIALALLDTAKLLPGGWAEHTTMAFAAMVGANVLLLRGAMAAAARVPVAVRADYSLHAEPVTTAAAEPGQHNGHRNGHQVPEGKSLRSLKFLKPLKSDTPRTEGEAGKARAWLAAAAVFLTAGWIAYAHPGPLLILAVVIVSVGLVSMMDVSRHDAITMVLATALGVSAVDYMSWRFSVTNWPGWWVSVPLLWAETLGAIHALGYEFTIWPRPAPRVEPAEDPTDNPIFILVPTVNEGVVTVRPTLEGCIAARQKYLAQHPNGQVTIVVCNDGRVAGYPAWEETEALAEELGVQCVTRTTGGGAKAGNIENARQLCQITGSSFLVIFDADQVPAPDFLIKTIPPFADPKVGWVQTGQYYSNLDNPVSRWADDQQSMFYHLLCPGKAAMNAAFICGTNVVIRSAALDEIGGLPQDSVTEDFAASIDLHRRWRSIYLTDVLATGLGPLDVPSFLKQQGRWALGTLAVFRGHWHDILLPKKQGLRLGQRVQYFLACTHYLCGLRDLIYVLSPVLFVITSVPAVRTASLGNYLWHFLPYGVLGMTAMWYSTRGVTGVRGIIIGFGSSPALIGSLLAVVLHRKKAFAITSKARAGKQSLRYLGIYLFILMLCLGALAWATQVTGRQATSLFISLLWISYSAVMLSSFLWLASKDIRVHAAAQRTGVDHDTVRKPYPAKLAMRRPARRPVLSAGLAAVLASPVLLVTPLASLAMSTTASPPFVITQRQADAQYAGLSLPTRSLTTEPSELGRDLGVRFSIIGRTQDISDQFDTAWASKLAAHGAHPWIVLQLGNFDRKHRAPITASLPAIINGVDDRELSRWATEIRDFGKPVYLTVLLQVDKNWSVSSGVANGGIPQDTPRAWSHMQSIFRAAGARNVAWVWAPADPLHDQQFAPPPSTIAAVMQDFINFPGTRWGSPSRVLTDLTRRYPGKPLFIEVSVSGPAARKAAWLADLGRAVTGCSQVFALIYHQGGPGLNPTPAQAKNWSLTSDPESLAAWKHIMTSLRGAGR
ncbi:MAG TPA: glycosyltransferase family 2 protein [Streptosporangiaceae bacterium]|nr:glycosyltransferase family 2 protein [Streptosporangiaceae bacterium]